MQARLIVQLKDNQPSLLQKVETACASQRPVSSDTSVCTGRNRHETRSADVFSADPRRCRNRVEVSHQIYRPRHPRGLASRCQDRPLEQHLRGRILRGQFCRIGVPRRHRNPAPLERREQHCTTLVTSLSRKINPASVVTRVSSCGCAASPTMCYAVTEPAPSVRTDTPPLSLVSVPWPTGASVESI